MRRIVIGALVTWVVAAIGCSRHPDAEQRAHAPLNAAEAELMSSVNDHIDHLEEAMRQQIDTGSDGRKSTAPSSSASSR